MSGVVLAASAVLAFVYAEEGAEHAAKLYPLTSTRGLSLGDRACLAVAKRLAAPAVTADQAWLELDHGVEVRLIRSAQ